jgi:hypothetical protein
MTEEPTGGEAVATAALADTRGDFTQSGNQGAGSGASLDTGNAGQPPAAPNPWDTRPQSWQQDLDKDWTTLPEHVRKYVHTRESQINEGFKRYGMTQKQWDKATEAFKPILAQRPDLDVAEIMQALSHNHLLLTQSQDPAERRALGLALLKQYGVDLEQAQEAAGTTNPDGLTPRQIEQLRQMLSPVLQTVETLSGTHQQQVMASAKTTVDKFFSDPQNKFANEVEGEILDVLKSGATRNLGEAYHLAMLRRPDVYAKFIADKAAGAGGSNSGAAGGLPNLKSNGGAASSAKPATMDDSINSVLAKHYPDYKPRVQE